MTLGPHEDNLRGELALEQIRAVAEATWPGVQRDIELRRVREIAEVTIVPTDEPLTPEGAAFGIRITPDASPVPVSPNLVALPGRYRAWVLPISGVAVALEQLEDEAVYLRAYRRHVLELQGIEDDAALERHGGRVVDVVIKRKKAHSSVVSFGPADNHRTPELFAVLFVGMAYRRHSRFFGRTIIEPVAPPEIVTTNVGPYR